MSSKPAPKTTSAVDQHDEDKVELTREEARLVREQSMAVLRSVLSPVKGKIILSLLAVVLAVACSTAMPWLIAHGINTAITPLMNGDATPLTTVVIAYGVLVVLSALLTYYNVVVTARISQIALFDLRQRMFVHSQKLSVGFHETYTSGRVISRLTSDLETLRGFLDSGLSQLATSVLTVIFTAVALITMDWRAGVALAIAMVPTFYLSRWFQRRSVIAYRAQRTVSAQLISRFVETITGIRAVKAFRSEAATREVYGERAEEYRLRTMDSIKVFGVYMPLLMGISNVFIGAVLVVGGYSVLGGSMQAGTLLALVIYSNRMFEPIFSLSEFYNQFQSASSALEKVGGFLAQKLDVTDPQVPAVRSSPAQGHVVLDEVEFEYVAGRPVLRRTNLDVPEGQRVALVGTTGAGKSTVAKLIARFYDVTHGSITLDGVDVRDLTDTQLRAEVVMVTQEAYLFEGTVADNIRLGNPEASEEQVYDAARAVGAYDFIQSLPQGFETNLNKRGGRVSAGQRQLISFARAFLADPVVLILDEATASLDLPSERQVQAGLETLLEGRTSFVIAHRLSTVLTSDRILVVDDGQIIEDGSPEELVDGGGRFAGMVAAWDEAMGDGA